MSNAISLDFHGVTVHVQSAFPEVIQDLEHDFAYFVAPSGPAQFSISVSARETQPRHWIALPRLGRSRFFVSPPGEVRVSYFESSWVSYRFKQGTCDIFSAAAVAYEVCFLMLLAYVGEALDRRGIHRIHGLGMKWRDEGMIVMAPSGGGKSTLALELLSDPEMKILSDDVPWLNQAGEILAFPQRIALRSRPDLPPDQIRTFKRVEYGEKFVIGSRYFREKITERAPLQWLVVIEKERGVPRLREVSRIALVLPLVRWLVLGLETPQVWEVFVRLSPADIVAKIGILVSRARLAWRLITTCRAARFRLSPDVAESGNMLKLFPWQTVSA